jgi:hypothetical protein
VGKWAERGARADALRRRKRPVPAAKLRSFSSYTFVYEPGPLCKRCFWHDYHHVVYIMT